MANQFEAPAPHIAHYYGDTVRMLFLGVALGSIVAIPLVGELLQGALYTLLGAILLVVLAALTHPHGTYILAANTVVSLCAVVGIELLALAEYGSASVVMFIAREAVVLVMLYAFYLSVKTVRAVHTHTLGHAEKAHEFDGGIQQ